MCKESFKAKLSLQRKRTKEQARRIEQMQDASCVNRFSFASSRASLRLELERDLITFGATLARISD